MNTSLIDPDGLQTLKESGVAPETRMATAADAVSRITVLMHADRQGRSQRRALIKGLVDGNPPYKVSDRRKAGRSSDCNVNWRVAEFYLSMGRFAFYDVFSETPTFATVETDFGESGKREEWSGIITEEFDKLVRTDNSWDRVAQFSINDMTLYGCGPLVFKDNTDWRNEFIPCMDLVVPDFAYSDPERWEEAAIRRDYNPTELFGFIRNDKEAKDTGWDIEATKKAIMQAHTYWARGQQFQAWEWHQQQLKNNAFWYNATAKMVRCVHYYFREFPEPGDDSGKITHTILVNPEDNQTQAPGSTYLFRHLRRFDSWNQIVHPMYYDNDGGGYHHSVTGLGQKMYSAMEYQNRLLCNIADKAFAPKVLFKPMTAQAEQAFNIVQFAEFGKIPAGFDIVQTPVQSFAEEGLALNREFTSIISSNLAQYRTALSRESGNPITAYEAQLRASDQSKLGRTQLNHYYNQLDWLYQEKFKRAANPELNGFMPGGREAVKFRSACQNRGVPPHALQKIRSVRATRTVGQGSQFMRQQALQQLLGVAAMIPNESGKTNIMEDYVAAVAGQSMVRRYMPREETPQMVDQIALATLQVAAAKAGVAPVVGGSQDHFLFARVFLQAGIQAIQAVQQPGSNPQEALAFIQVIGPPTISHIQKMMQDPSRQAEAKEMMSQVQQLEQAAQKITQQMQQQAQQAQQQQQQLQQQGQEQVTEQKLAIAELQHKTQLSDTKAQSDMQRKGEKHQQSMALADASTASGIQRANAVAAAKLKQDRSQQGD